MNKKIPNVALMLQIEASHGRRIMRGIIQYAHTYGHWYVYTDQGVPMITLDKLVEWEGDGIIANIGNKKQLEALKTKRIPVVNVSNTLKKVNLPSVVHDEEAIGKLGAEHFLERGFKYFAFCGDSRFAWSIRRKNGFEQAIKEAGFIPQSFYNFRRGEKKAFVRWIERLPLPIGLMACHDTRGRILIDICEEKGLLVPDEVAVLGVDDDEMLTQLPYPMLSSVIPAGERVGYEAARMLNQIMSGKKLPSDKIIIKPAGITPRQSSNVFPVDDPEVAQAVKFIRDHASKPIWVPDILSEVLIPRRTLERRFRAALGRSITEEIIRTRIERAKMLLRETNLNIAKIAVMSGYTTVEQLYRVFQKKVGASPGVFRSECRNK